MRKLKTEEIERITADEFHEAKKTPLVVVLDNVRSLLNVGSVFRTADAYRIEELILCGITATPPHAEIHKSALGAEYSVRWSHYDETLDAVRRLHCEGYTVLSVEQATGSIMLNEFTPDPARKYAVILGNEVKGVQQSVIDASDGCLELPQYGTKHSLNVSVTAGIVMWEMATGLIGKLE